MTAAEQQEVLQSLYEVHTAHAEVEMTEDHARRVKRLIANGKHSELLAAERRPRGTKRRGGQRIQLRRIQHALQMLGVRFVPQQEAEAEAEAEQKQKSRSRSTSRRRR